MNQDAKIILQEYAKTAGTESNVVKTADIEGWDQVFIGLKANVGTVDGTGNMDIKVEASILGGTSTAYSTVVSTTELAAWAISTSSAVATEKTLMLSRESLKNGCRYLKITVNNSATDDASESWLSVVALTPYTGTAADYVV